MQYSLKSTVIHWHIFPILMPFNFRSYGSYAGYALTNNVHMYTYGYYFVQHAFPFAYAISFIHEYKQS